MIETYLPKARELSAKNHLKTTKKFLTYLLPSRYKIVSIHSTVVELTDTETNTMVIATYNDIAFNICKPMAVRTFNTEIISYQNKTFGVARYDNLSFGGASEAEAVIKATMELTKLHWK